MEIKNLLEAKDRDTLRQWLLLNHKTEPCCWVKVSISKKPEILLYLDVVEEALCFGWVDGIKKKLPDGQLAQRLSPRKKNSNWTELNKERVRRLDKLGLMTSSGKDILPDMKPDSFVIDIHIQEELEKNPIVYSNFMNFPELYRTIRIDTIQSEKKNKEVFTKRLDKLIENTSKNKMYGKWNDDGRLLDY